MNKTARINQENLEALNKLKMPTYRIVADVTTDEHLGKMHFKQWRKVEADITLALDDNTQAYFEAEVKILKTKQEIKSVEIPF